MLSAASVAKYCQLCLIGMQDMFMFIVTAINLYFPVYGVMLINRDVISYPLELVCNVYVMLDIAYIFYISFAFLCV